MSASYHQHVFQAIRSNAEINPLFESSSQFPLAHRTAVYRQTCLESRAKALQEIFPRCHALFPQQTRIAVQEYISIHPATQPSLEHYGSLFANYLSDCTPSLPAWAGDLARFEWQVHLAELAYPASSQPRANPLEQLTRLSERQLQHVVLLPADNLAAAALQWPVADYWDNSAEPPQAPPTRQPTFYVFYYRNKLQVQQVTAAQFQFVCSLANGLDFQSASTHPELEAAVQQHWIAGWRFKAETGDDV